MLTTNRRGFLQSFGALFAVGTSSSPVSYVGTRNSIQVFRIQRGRRINLQSLASLNPSYLTLDADRKLLFAVNEISEHKGLPTGTVESYSIRRDDGHLTLITRAALSLSATCPRHVAISPDGRYLVVAVFGGGAYNVLPIDSDGQLGPVTQILKEVGKGIHSGTQSSAHPHSVAFHPSGKFVLGTDLGCDRINVFAFKAGAMTPIQRFEVRPGSGPAHLEMALDGLSASVRCELRPATDSYNFDPVVGQLTASTIKL